jgi:glycosyltransferase involved in cell wall biosynthesis
MKIVWYGNVFNATGIATANREIVKALVKQGHQVQCADIWNSKDFNKGLEFLNSSINPTNEDTVTIFADYPQYWQNGFGKIYGFFLHEGTRLFPDWSQKMNMTEKVFVPSMATKNLFKWNGVFTPIIVVPYGVNPEIYKPGKNEEEADEFIFLSVNSWNLKDNDRKGISLLVRAFDEEFKDNPKIKLFLKISTFYRKVTMGETALAIKELLGHDNPNILINTDCLPEEKLAELYNAAGCFVMPTHGESFGLTAINAMACGIPLIITKDSNSGYMDFCKGKDSVLWIDAPKMEQADLQFFVPGNFQPVPELDSLKKQMRFAFENQKDLKEKALKNSEEIRLNWNWDISATKLIEVMK